MRVGIGYDIHALAAGRRLILGGVQLPFPKGLVGHSDGDAVWHAAVDAVLGAMGEGDIGEHFPDRDARFKGVSSILFVQKANALLKRKKLKITNLDITVITEKPKLGPWKNKIRQSTAKAFGLKASQVNLKAKTNEGFGDIGRGRAIACLAIVSLK